MDSLLRPAGEAGLCGDDHRRVDDERIAQTDRRLGTIVAFRCADATSDVPHRGSTWETIVVRPAAEQTMAANIGIDANREIVSVVDRRDDAEVIVRAGKWIARRVGQRIS